jgi:ubiquinone/menaquinone biosynthesis C-methylase UbiE
MRQEKSDEMFVKWSKFTNDQSWDTQFVAELIKIRKLSHGLDVGGGIGTFANSILNLNDNIQSIDVVDPSIQAHLNFVEHQKTTLIKGHMSNINNSNTYDFITVNLVCHHIISHSNIDTFEAQVNFLKDASNFLEAQGVLLLEENIYESYLFEDLCGRLIYEITSLRGIEKITRKLGANTAGEGVRFHSDTTWRKIFARSGFKVVQTHDNLWEGGMPIWQKIPLLCKNRYQRIYVLQKDA